MVRGEGEVCPPPPPPPGLEPAANRPEGEPLTATPATNAQTSTPQISEPHTPMHSAHNQHPTQYDSRASRAPTDNFTIVPRTPLSSRATFAHPPLSHDISTILISGPKTPNHFPCSPRTTKRRPRAH